MASSKQIQIWVQISAAPWDGTKVLIWGDRETTCETLGCELSHGCWLCFKFRARSSYQLQPFSNQPLLPIPPISSKQKCPPPKRVLGILHSMVFACRCSSTPGIVSSVLAPLTWVQLCNLLPAQDTPGYAGSIDWRSPQACDRDLLDLGDNSCASVVPPSSLPFCNHKLLPCTFAWFSSWAEGGTTLH